MSKLKSIQRSGTLAWSTSAERPALLAAGTVAGAIDDSFECTAHLEIFDLDLASPGHDMPLLGSVTTSERFQRLAWGAGSGAAGFEHGVLAGGMVDGSIKIFNPARILGGQPDEAVVATIDKHHGPVRGLEFNWNQPNLLASGASDADMYITDLAAPASPTFYTPGQRQAGGGSADVTCVAWNRKVHHILASTTNSGQTVVWDLKLKRPVISFNDPNNKTQRNSVVCWNPEVATQLIVASEDDACPLLQMWDLRNAFAPVKDLRGHTKGILAASWCPFDNALLLSAGKDNRTLCWDPLSGAVLCELPASANWNFDVQWSPRLPAVLCTGSFDGHVAVHCLTDTAPHHDSWQAHGGAEVAPAARRAPKWLRRPCGGSFGFGGQLVTFAPPAQLPGGGSARPRVHHYSVATERGLVARAAELRAALDSGSVHAYCAAKAAGAGQGSDGRGGSERAVWGLLGVLSSEDARQQLISYLRIDSDGVAPFAEPAPGAGAEAAAGKEPAPDDDAVDGGGSLDIAAAQSLAELTLADGGAALELRDQMAPAQPGANGHGGGAPVPLSAAPLGGRVEAEVRRLLVSGLFGEAVDACLAHGHRAEALLIAASGGPELWARARDRLLGAHAAPCMRVLGAVVHGAFGPLVDASSVGHWRETLAILNTYAPDDELAALCNRLAERLQAAGGEAGTALLCYICAGNVRAATRLWLQALEEETVAGARGGAGGSAGARGALLLGFAERLLVLRRVTADGGQDTPPEVGERLAELGELLAAQGQLQSAAALLAHAAPAGGSGAALLWRLLQTGRVPPTPSGLGFGSPPPFAMADVGMAPEPAPRAIRRAAAALGGGAGGPGGPGCGACGCGDQSELFAAHSQGGGDAYLPHAPHSAAPIGGAGCAGYGAQPQPQPLYGGCAQQPAGGAGCCGGYAAPAYARPQPQPLPAYAQPPAGYAPPGACAYAYGASAPPPQPQMPPPRAYAPPPAGGAAQFAPPPAYAQPPPQMQPPPMQQMMPQMPPQMQPMQPPPAQPAQPPPPAFVPQPAYGVAAPSPTGYAPPPPAPHAQGGCAGPMGAASCALPAPAVFTPVAQPQLAQQHYAPQHAAPPEPAPQPPLPPPAPQRMSDVDLSGLGGAGLHVARTLGGYMEGLLAQAQAQPMERRKLEDVSKRLAGLLLKLAAHELQPPLLDKLLALTQATAAGDLRTALALHVEMTTSDWAQNGPWLVGLKRLLEALRGPAH